MKYKIENIYTNAQCWCVGSLEAAMSLCASIQALGRHEGGQEWEGWEVVDEDGTSYIPRQGGRVDAFNASGDVHEEIYLLADLGL